jgi:exonuclease III
VFIIIISKKILGTKKLRHISTYIKKNKPYHTDYIYLKKNTLDTIKKFSVGQYGEWGSDHMPLFIEI